MGSIASSRKITILVASLGLILVAGAMTMTSALDRVFADSQSASHLHIDADPTNGTGPCFPIDTAASVAPGGAVAVAYCFEEADLEPINGGVTNLALFVDYAGAGFTAPNNPGDATLGQGGNPNWNQAGLGGAGIWDCNQLNAAAAAPKASPSPATITCTTNNVQNQAIPATAHLATLTFNAAPASGSLELSWSSGSNVLSGFFEGFCGTDFTCTGATITVAGADPPTNTPTNTPTATNTLAAATNTPTATNTIAAATSTPTATNTPVAGATNTPTATNTVAAATNTPTATNTQVVGATDTPTATATNTQVVVATDTPVPTATNTPEDSNTPELTQTVEVTRTVLVTRTVEVTKTVGTTETPEVTPTEQIKTHTPTVEIATETPTSTSTSTPVNTATASPTEGIKTHTPVPTETDDDPTRTSTVVATTTRPASTVTAVSTVSGITTAPNPGGSGGATSLPNSGQGDGGPGTDWMVGILSIMAAGIGLFGVVIWRRRMA